MNKKMHIMRDRLCATGSKCQRGVPEEKAQFRNNLPLLLSNRWGENDEADIMYTE